MGYKKLRKNIKKQLEDDLGELVGQKIGSNLSEQMSFSKQVLSAKLEATLFGLEVTDIQTGWESMDYSEKLEWYLCNKVFPRIAENARRLHYESRMEFNNSLEDDDYQFFNVKLPLIFESNPKGIAIIESKMLSPTPLKCIGLKEALNRKDDDDKS